MEAQLTCGFELLAQFANIDDVAEGHFVRSINHCESGAGLGKVLPDELKHEEFVEIGIEQ